MCAVQEQGQTRWKIMHGSRSASLCGLDGEIKIVFYIKGWDYSTGKTMSDLAFLFLLERFQYITNEITINRNIDQLLKNSPSLLSLHFLMYVLSLEMWDGVTTVYGLGGSYLQWLQ